MANFVAGLGDVGNGGGLVRHGSNKGDNALTERRQCVDALVRPLWDKRYPTMDASRPHKKTTRLRHGCGAAAAWPGRIIGMVGMG